MVDTLVSGASASRRVGSTPISGTKSPASVGLFFWYAQHGHALTGESPQCALMTGSI